MGYLSKCCVYLFVVLFASISKARHLTERQSDAATRTSKSLSQPRLAFLNNINTNPAKTEIDNVWSAATQPVADTNKKDEVTLHTQNGESNIDPSNVITQNNIPMRGNNEKGTNMPNPTKYTRTEQQQIHRHIEENDVRVNTGNNETNIQGLTHLDIKHKDDMSQENKANEFIRDEPQTVTIGDSTNKSNNVSQHKQKMSISESVTKPVNEKLHNSDSESEAGNSEKSHMVIRHPSIIQNKHAQSKNSNKHPVKANSKEAKTQGTDVRTFSKDNGTVLKSSIVSTGADVSSAPLRPKVTVFIEENNSHGSTHRVMASNGNGVIQSRPVHSSNIPLPVSENQKDSSNLVGNGSENIEESKNNIETQRQDSVPNDQTTAGEIQSLNKPPPIAVLENVHDNAVPVKQAVESAESNTDMLHNLNKNKEAEIYTPAVNAPGSTSNEPETTTSMIPTTEVYVTTKTTIADETSSTISKTTIDPEPRRPADVDPLDIFTSDITYQRFPQAMSLTIWKKRVMGKRLKKLYILEESEKKLFQHVRQLEAIYTIEDGTLYVSFLFRFVYSRKCQEIAKFKMGKLVGNTDIAMFEKELKDEKTERILFFSERPDDYVFFMSCTDMKTSPYACRDSYYITLDSAHDPPNQFPWADAASELASKLSLTFEDPRFIFNFVLLPCARRSTTS